jgi:ABC-type uncharacterized transport system substrate-binding protein
MSSGISVPAYQTTTFGGDVLKGLGEAGFIDGRNVAIEYQFARLELAQLPELASSLVRDRVRVIVAIYNAAALAAKSVTTTIPIVFAIGSSGNASACARRSLVHARTLNL